MDRRWIAVATALSLGGCGSYFKDLAASESSTGAVVATWTTREDVESWVQYGPSEDECDTHITGKTSGTEHSGALVELTPNSTTCWQAVTADKQSKTQEYSRGVAPGGQSYPEVTVNQDGAWSEPFILMTMVAGAPVPAQFIIDRDSNSLFVHQMGSDRQTVDGNQNAALDGINFNDFALDHSVDDSWLRFIGYDGSSQRDVRTELGHHAYVLLDDGRIAYLGLDIRDQTGYEEPVVGDTLEIIGTDGSVSQLWNAWDVGERFPLAVDSDNGSFYPNEVDWTHCDTVTYAPARDSWVLSCRNINTVLELDSSGQITRSIGEFGEYAIDGYDLWSDIIAHPHNAVYTDQGTLLLLSMPQTGEFGGSQPVSQILELTFDDEAKTAAITWQFDAGVNANIEGGADRLPSGNTLINWGAAGLVQEVTPGKEVVWQAEFGLGNVAGHAHALSSLVPTE